jgi:hypothetical protein
LQQFAIDPVAIVGDVDRAIRSDSKSGGIDKIREQCLDAAIEAQFQNAAGRRRPKVIAVLEQVERIVRSCGNVDEITEAAGKRGDWIDEVVAEDVG